MDDAIIPRAVIVAKAERMYKEGKPLSDCPYHPWTAAAKTHAGVYRRLNNEARIAANQRNQPFQER